MLELQDLKKPIKIIVHCSASEWGDVETLRKWHLARGFDEVGYHAIIGNGYTSSSGDFNPYAEGVILGGRDVKYIGAHDYPNRQKIGICLIGNGRFTGAQFATLKKLIKMYQSRYTVTEVLGHYETEGGKRQGKTCPLFDMSWFRKYYLDTKSQEGKDGTQ